MAPYSASVMADGTTYIPFNYEILMHFALNWIDIDIKRRTPCSTASSSRNIRYKPSENRSHPAPACPRGVGAFAKSFDNLSDYCQPLRGNGWNVGLTLIHAIKTFLQPLKEPIRLIQGIDFMIQVVARILSPEACSSNQNSASIVSRRTWVSKPVLLCISRSSPYKAVESSRNWVNDPVVKYSGTVPVHVKIGYVSGCMTDDWDKNREWDVFQWKLNIQ